MALPCYVNFYTFRSLPSIGCLPFSSPFLQRWRCFPHVMHRPKSTVISVRPSVVVEAVAGGHLAEKIGGVPISRRDASVAAMAFVCMAALLLEHPQPANARQRRNTKAIPIEDYKISRDGIKYYDLVEGNGPEANKGSTVLVHFDCVYRGLTVVSSRESKLLAGNRAIAQPYEFTVGAIPGKERKRDFADNPNGLYSAQAAPKPPAVLYTITEADCNCDT